MAKLLLAKWKRCKISISHQTHLFCYQKGSSLSRAGGRHNFYQPQKHFYFKVDIFTASKANFILAMLWFWVKKGGSWKHHSLSEISYSVSEKIFSGLWLNWSQPHRYNIQRRACHCTTHRSSAAAWSHPCVLVSISIIRNSLSVHIHITGILTKSAFVSVKQLSQLPTLYCLHNWLNFNATINRNSHAR